MKYKTHITTPLDELLMGFETSVPCVFRFSGIKAITEMLHKVKASLKKE